MSQFDSELRKHIRSFSNPEDRIGWQQTLIATGLYIAVWSLMLMFPAWSWLFAIPAGLLLVRIFVLQHDCGHYSLFKDRKLNDVIGTIFGVITLTPLLNWRVVHNAHHATPGRLDRRGEGDVWTLTVEEYQRAPASKRLLYRIYRNPIVLFVLGPMFYFLIRRRFPIHLRKDQKRERLNLHLTNMGILTLYGGLSFAFGTLTVLIAGLPVVAIGAAIGVWLFYVQHNFENTYWEHDNNWNLTDAALKGSSYYALPALLNWFTADIAVHHVHHLSSGIPNYRLRECMNSTPLLKPQFSVNFPESLRLAKLRLWNEKSKAMVPLTGTFS